MGMPALRRALLQATLFRLWNNGVSSQALHRLASQYMKRDGLRGRGEPSDSRSVFTVWRSLIEATVHTSLSRVAASENYRALTSETTRTLRAAKEQRAKKSSEQLLCVQGELVEASSEQLLCVQGELVEAVRELSKVKKRYYHLERITELARDKSKKNDYGIFHFRTNLQKLNTKLSNRLSECNLQLTEARNEYLLTLAAVNSHQEHYHSKDLPALIKDLDGDLYERLREHFTLLSQTEIDSCQATQSAFLGVLQDSCQVSREHDLQLFLQENPVFTKAPVFLFQGAPSDKACGLVHQGSAQGGESCLEKEARKWATKAAKDYKIKTHGERVSRVKADSRLALLRLAGVETDSWVTSAMNQVSEELESERRLSEARLSNGAISPLEDEFDFEDFDDGEIFTESAPSPCPRSYPLPCRVLYSYQVLQTLEKRRKLVSEDELMIHTLLSPSSFLSRLQACQADELSITEDEELEVIEDGDMEDWLKLPPALPGSVQLSGLARALYPYCGQSGEELSFPEGAVIRLLRCGDVQVDDGFWEGELNGRVGVFPSLVVELLGEEEEEEEEDRKVSMHSNHFYCSFSWYQKSGLKKESLCSGFRSCCPLALLPSPPRSPSLEPHHCQFRGVRHLGDWRTGCRGLHWGCSGGLTAEQVGVWPGREGGREGRESASCSCSEGF
ncbi:UNVERIFIED_CONTAM: hypothetical protein FKN15_072891 [Acipenser sinensis]